MVDVTEKPQTTRTATASGKIFLKRETLNRIQEKSIAKGDVLSVAKVAGIMTAKKVPDLIPLCHSLNLTGAEVELAENNDLNADGMASIGIRATIRTLGQTGVEMEALAAVSVTALTIYDMCKSVDRDMVIGEIMLDAKSGGRSESYERKRKGI